MSITDNLAKRLMAKAAVAGLDRLDLSLQDYAVLKDGATARVLISYDKKLNHPQPQAIAKFVTAKFDGRLEANMATALWHIDAQTPSVSVIVSARTRTRPLTDKAEMIPVIANTLYMDQTIGANWEVKVNAHTGKKFLCQVRTEDIDGMLNSAKAKYATASFVGSHTAIGFILPEKGDYVEFFAEDGLRQGEVSKTKGNEATIIDEGGETYLIEIPSITKMLRKNAKSQNQADEQMIQALIPAMVTRELAEQVVRGPRR